MMRLPEAYFEAKYAESTDPWGFTRRFYEARKYALTVAALPRERYRRAFEPGASIGVLTAMLAPRCEEVVATELVPRIAEVLRRRLLGEPHVEVRAHAIPDAWPEGSFDLMVFSEVLYYLSEDGLREVLARVDDSLEVGGHVVAVHWRGETDHPLSGDAVHRALEGHPGLRTLARYEEESFRLTVLERSRS